MLRLFALLLSTFVANQDARSFGSLKLRWLEVLLSHCPVVFTYFVFPRGCLDQVCGSSSEFALDVNNKREKSCLRLPCMAPYRSYHRVLSLSLI